MKKQNRIKAKSIVDDTMAKIANESVVASMVPPSRNLASPLSSSKTKSRMGSSPISNYQHILDNIMKVKADNS